MPTPMNPRENASTTYIVNQEDPNETTRLLALDEVITREMGRLLPDAFNPGQITNVLDLACGPGAWALNVARSYPEMDVVGVDISQKMIRYANAQADALDLENVSFQAMNILQPLDFPDAYFDVVNARLIHSFVPVDVWLTFLQECLRITRPGGFIRLSEAEWAWTNGTACEQINGRATRALWMTGKGFFPEGKLVGITLMLPKFLRDAGLQDIQQQPYAIDYSYGTSAHESMYQMALFGYPLLFPFLQKTTGITQEEFDQLSQQALEEMQSESFRGLYFFLSAWGKKPNG